MEVEYLVSGKEGEREGNTISFSLWHLLMVRVSWGGSVDDGVEAVVLVGGVVDGSD